MPLKAAFVSPARDRVTTRMMLVMLVLSAASSAALAQQFTSGSDGTDGALDFPNAQPGDVILFNPHSFNPPLDADGDNVYHFTTINIPQGVTVKITALAVGHAPVYWLATGDITVAGTLDVSGGAGHPGVGNRFRSIPGPGGFPGGYGRTESTEQTNGLGPGAGNRPVDNNCWTAGGGGHANSGRSGNATGGSAYGNSYLQPLIGGSGGGGGAYCNSSGWSAGGGAGGGAILLASTTGIELSGTINGRGGHRGPSGGSGGWGGGGGGAGGAVRLVAPQVSGAGTIDCRGGDGSVAYPGAGSGGDGRYRVESYAFSESIIRFGIGTQTTIAPNTRLLPAQYPSAVRIVSINGVPVTPIPGGNIQMPDVVLNAPGPVPVVFEAPNIPTGTNLTLRLTTPELEDMVVNAAVDAQGMAMANVTFPPGFSQFIIRATWN